MDYGSRWMTYLYLSNYHGSIIKGLIGSHDSSVFELPPQAQLRGQLLQILEEWEFR